MFTQASNRRHHRSGHLFQGRFKGILVDKPSYLLELSRYVVLNPVRAGMVKRVEAYPWSSYRAMMGKASVPTWLATDGLLSHFGKRRAEARQRYGRFVQEGIGRASVWSELRQQMYLGDEKFVERMQRQIKVQGDELSIPRAHRKAVPLPLSVIAAKHRERNVAIMEAYETGAYSYREIAAHFGLHLATVGRVIRGAMLRGGN